MCIFKKWVLGKLMSKHILPHFEQSEKPNAETPMRPCAAAAAALTLGPGCHAKARRKKKVLCDYRTEVR